MSAANFARTLAVRATASAGYRLSRLSSRLQAPPPLTAPTREERRTLTGDRDIEWSWCFATLPSEPGRVLDFGAGNGFLSLGAAFRGHSVIAVDLEPRSFSFEDDRIAYRQGDFLQMEFEDASFDHIINCSSIEHVGLPGRYGSPDVPDGDLAAMRKMRELLRPDRTMGFVVPVGRDAVYSPLHRVYGERRLPEILEGFVIEREEFRAKPRGSFWERVERDAALAEQGSTSYYAIGLFLLRR